MSTVITRSQFLKGALAGVAGVGAMGLAGCAANAQPTSVPETGAEAGSALFSNGTIEGAPDNPATQGDIIVVGAGAAGMAAAVTAAEEGMNVILVEANAAAGGTTQFAEGIAGVATDIQKAAGNNINVQDLVDGELVFSNYCADARLIRDFLEGADENINWLMDMGVEFYPDVINVTQHLYVGQGGAMIEKLVARADELGVTPFYGTTAKQLYIEDGKVAGLLCEGEGGKEVQLAAPTVVLACGGYIQNDDMVDGLQRFSHESLVTNPSCIDNIILNQKRAVSILTDAEAERLATEGCTVGWGSYIFAGSPMADLRNQLDQAVAGQPAGFYYGATIEELAEAADLNADNLRQTIANYNKMVASGADTEFGKKPPFLHEVPESGPFYAFDLKCSAFCTMDGIRVNQQNEILNEDFEAIPGLYCAGVDCSGLQGTTYCMGIGGGAQGYAVYSGRNSARNAKAYLSA